MKVTKGGESRIGQQQTSLFKGENYVHKKSELTHEMQLWTRKTIYKNSSPVNTQCSCKSNHFFIYKKKCLYII